MSKILSGVVSALVAVTVHAQSTSTATTVVEPTGTGTTVTAPIKEVAPAPKKWTLSYVAESFADAAPADRGNWDGAVGSYQHVGMAYDLGNKRKIQYRQYFYYNQTDAARSDEWSIGEHVFTYSDAESAKVAGHDLATQVRLYIPGSEYVREVGQYQLRLYNSISQKFGKTTVEYLLNPRFYTYTDDSSGQIAARVLPVIGVEYEANKWMTPFASVYTDHRWYHNGRGPGLLDFSAGRIADPAANRDVFVTDVGAKFSLNKNISLSLYLETAKDLRNHKNYDPFTAANNTYMLDLAASL